MCSDTAPARAPALSAPPQGAPGRLCACTVVAATATPHLRGEDEHARQPPLTHTGPHPAPVDAKVAVESRPRAHPTAPAHPTTKFIAVPSGALRRVSPPVGGRVARSRRSRASSDGRVQKARAQHHPRHEHHRRLGLVVWPAFCSRRLAARLAANPFLPATSSPPPGGYCRGADERPIVGGHAQDQPPTFRAQSI